MITLVYPEGSGCIKPSELRTLIQQFDSLILSLKFNKEDNAAAADSWQDSSCSEGFLRVEVVVPLPGFRIKISVKYLFLKFMEKVVEFYISNHRYKALQSTHQTFIKELKKLSLECLISNRALTISRLSKHSVIFAPSLMLIVIRETSHCQLCPFRLSIMVQLQQQLVSCHSQG